MCRICMNNIKNPVTLLGVVSPWIRAIANFPNRFTKLIICSECEGGGFTATYSEQQMNNLYSDYRGSQYVKIRSKWEKWYSYNYNLAHERKSLIEQRKSQLENFISQNTNIAIETVLDVGGDRGQFIPNFITISKKYILDKSNREIEKGVQRIEKLEDLPTVDLIIYAHTLEHVVNPLEELKNLIEISKVVYVEVPFGVPKNNIWRRSSVLQLIFVAFSRIPLVWSFLAVPAAGRPWNTRILRQSEHLNFFNGTTLRVLAEKLDMRSVISECFIPTPDSEQARVLQCLIFK